MGGNGKHRRWKISFYRSSSAYGSEPKLTPPKEFICPISGSLMADPVVVTSGHTFERVSVKVCRNLGFVPFLYDGSRPDFSTVIPNLAIKSTIRNWCTSNGVAQPRVPEYDSIEKAICLQTAAKEEEDDKFRDSERELLRGVAETPPVNFSHAATELNPAPSYFYSSSEESVVVLASPATPLPLTTRPSCYSSSSSETLAEEVHIGNVNPTSAEEEEFVSKMRSNEVHEQEQAVISLRKLTRTNEEARVSLCTLRLLYSLRSMIISRYAVVQANAVASLVNLSLEKPNKVKIVRSGIVPPLIDALKSGSTESQEHAAGAIFSLALEDDNKTAIGVLGALQPLLHALRSESERARQDSALALYHLSLVQINRVKLVRFGAVQTLMTLLGAEKMAARVILVICNLAACNDARAALLDANAVAILVGMLRAEEDDVATRENVVVALYSLSHGSLRFKGLAREAAAADVLRKVADYGSERVREKAKTMLQMVRGREEGVDMAEAEFVVTESGGLTRASYRAGFAANSTDF